jgi:hypothetical protein
MNYLIDPQGHWWRWPSSSLAERLGYTDPDFDLAGYAARNLGYVWLVVDKDVTLLQFRAGMISQAAVNSLKPYLQKAIASRPVGLVYFASGWLEEAYIEAEPLLARLEQLAPLPEARMRDQFIRVPQLPYDWLYTAPQQLSSIFELWRFEAGEFSVPVQRFLKNSGLAERTVLLQPGEDGELYVDNSGAGFTVYDNFSFHRNQSRRRIEDQPDRAYGRWVAEAYRHSLQHGVPQIDDIDAIIDEPGYDARRRRYQRVILRWRLPTGGTLLTGSSLINQNISIPLNVGSVQPQH